MLPIETQEKVNTIYDSMEDKTYLGDRESTAFLLGLVGGLQAGMKILLDSADEVEDDENQEGDTEDA